MSRCKIKFWVMPNAGFETLPFLKKELSLFHERHPHIEVEPSIVSWSTAWQRMIHVIKRKPAVSEVPDVLQIGSTWQTTLSYMGGLRNLSGLADSEMITDFIEPLLGSCYFKSKIFAIPWFSDIRVLYYRKDILRALGLKEESLCQWESFRKVLSQIKKKFGNKISPMCLSGQSEIIQMHDLAPWIWSKDADFLDADLRKSKINDPKAVQAVHFYLDLINHGYIPLMGRDRVTFGNFFSGDSAFQISGAWPGNIFNPQSHKYNATVAKNAGVVPIPHPSKKGTSVTFIGGSHLAMMSSSQKVSESWALIRFLTEKERQENHAKRVGVLPPRLSSFKTSFFGSHHEKIESAFQNAILNSRTLPSLPILGSIEQLIRHLTEDTLNIIRSKSYKRELLTKLLNKTSMEIDYLLSLYA